MSKRKNEKTLAVWLFAISAVLTGGFISAPANAGVDYVLMVQQTPVDGGTVSPETGVHNISANGNVKVTATPKPGYQFVYWLGDVSDPTANSTVVSVNAPKIVVAVFQRSEYDLPFEAPVAAEGAGGGGGGGLSPNRQYVGGGGDVSPASGGNGSYKSYGPRYIINPPADTTTNDGQKPPVPEVPEPATMLLLGIGSLLAFKRNK